MADAYQGVTDLAESIPTIVAAEALGFLKANTVMARLVARDWDDEVASYGKVITIPYLADFSVNAKAEGTKIILQEAADSVYTVTLDQHNEVSFLLEDIAEAVSKPDYLALMTKNAMAVVAEEIDADLTALSSGFSQVIDASAGLGEDDFRSARRLLNSARAPLASRYAVLHEDAEFEALGIERIVNRDYTESLGSMAAGSFSGRFGGFDIFMDQKIVIASTLANNMFFQKDALVLASRPLPLAKSGGVIQSVMSEDGIGLRATLSYDHDFLGWKVTIDVLYGVAELRDTFGVEVNTTEI